MNYSRKIQIALLIAVTALLITSIADLVLLLQINNLFVLKALFMFIFPYMLSSIFKELKRQDLLPKLVFPKIKKRKPDDN